MMNFTKNNIGWVMLVVVFLVLPHVFTQSFALSLMTQMGIAIIFALSYNMLLGQVGLLSFGHAVYYGLGAFFTAHLINWIASGVIWFPITLVPIFGGLCGMFFGFIFGVVTTRRPGTPFAMISLGIAEMVAASALMFTAFFGGEAGIDTNRTAGGAMLGISYGPQIQVYYLVVAWCIVSIVGMYAITRTPLGRMANAVRDNPERAKFVGYNPTRVRWMTMTLAGFFAGLAGSLYIINYEIVTFETLGILESGRVVLMAFIGGIGHFWGPIIGAVLVTFLQSALSNYTEAWLLYFGLLFLVIIMFSPGGIAGLIAKHDPVMKAGLLRRLWPSYMIVSATGAVMLLGFISIIEMIYHVESAISGNDPMVLFGVMINPSTLNPWLVILLMFAVGTALFVKATRRVGQVWDELGPDLQSKGVI